MVDMGKASRGFMRARDGVRLKGRVARAGIGVLIAVKWKDDGRVDAYGAYLEACEHALPPLREGEAGASEASCADVSPRKIVEESWLHAKAQTTPPQQSCGFAAPAMMKLAQGPSFPRKRESILL